jgi:hypothetical protein
MLLIAGAVASPASPVVAPTASQEHLRRDPCLGSHAPIRMLKGESNSVTGHIVGALVAQASADGGKPLTVYRMQQVQRQIIS